MVVRPEGAAILGSAFAEEDIQTFALAGLLALLSSPQEPTRDEIDRVVRACAGSFLGKSSSFSMKTSLDTLDGVPVLVLDDEICGKETGFEVRRFRTFCRKDAWLSPIRIDYSLESHLPKAVREKKKIGEKVSITGSVSFGEDKAVLKVAALEGWPDTDDREFSEKAVRKLFDREQKLEPVELGGQKIAFRTFEPALLRTALLAEPKKGFLRAFVLPEDVVVKIRFASSRDEGDVRVVSFGSASYGLKTGPNGVETHVTAGETLHGVEIKENAIAGITWRRQPLDRVDDAKLAEFKRAGIAAVKD